MQTTNCIQNTADLKSAIDNLFYHDPITAEEEQSLYNQIINYLETTPAVQLIPAENIIRQAWEDSHHDEFYGEILQEVGLAKAEQAAYYNGIYEPEEDWFDMMSEEDQKAYEEWEASMNSNGGADLI